MWLAMALPPQAAMAADAPSAAAAAGAAAAALLQQQQQQQAAGAKGGDQQPDGWTEHQTGDGRKFFFHEETQTSTWEKPTALMSPEELKNDTAWREYKIWDGRVFYHNRETKVSCWSMPPEIRRLRGESAGVDERPVPLTVAERRRAFWDLLRERGIDDNWEFKGLEAAMASEPRAEALSEAQRKQCFAELLSFCRRQQRIEAREKERNAANALERLIEDRFSQPEDLSITYEEAATMLENEEAWQLIKSDIRRDEVFQNVMERLETKHQKQRAEKRADRVLRLQRLMATDAELKKPGLEWKDAVAILAQRDELHEEDPPVEALRVWVAVRDLQLGVEATAEAAAAAAALGLPAAPAPGAPAPPAPPVPPPPASALGALSSLVKKELVTEPAIKRLRLDGAGGMTILRAKEELTPMSAIPAIPAAAPGLGPVFAKTPLPRPPLMQSMVVARPKLSLPPSAALLRTKEELGIGPQRVATLGALSSLMVKKELVAEPALKRMRLDGDGGVAAMAGLRPTEDRWTEEELKAPMVPPPPAPRSSLTASLSTKSLPPRPPPMMSAHPPAMALGAARPKLQLPPPAPPLLRAKEELGVAPQRMEVGLQPFGAPAAPNLLLCKAELQEESPLEKLIAAGEAADAAKQAVGMGRITKEELVSGPTA